MLKLPGSARVNSAGVLGAPEEMKAGDQASEPGSALLAFTNRLGPTLEHGGD